MKVNTWLARAAFGLVLLASIGGCKEESDAEQAAEKTADTVGDATRHAGEEVESKTKDAADAVNDTVKDAQN